MSNRAIYGGLEALMVLVGSRLRRYVVVEDPPPSMQQGEKLGGESE
jgi:hypothetical protein